LCDALPIIRRGEHMQQPQSYAFNDDDDALFTHNSQYHRQIDGQRDRQHYHANN